MAEGMDPPQGVGPGREGADGEAPVPVQQPPEPAASAPSGWAPPSPPERPLPRGCHPLVFGVVMATLEMAALAYFMPSCFGLSG